MVGYFYDYIRNIIIFLLFTSFLQIIMPNDRYKNYIQLVLGMILIFIMIKPAKDLFKNFEKIDFNKSYEETFITEYDEQKYVEIHNEMVYGLFEENIKAQIEKIIGNKYKINSIEIKLEEDKYYNVVVTQINLILSKKEISKIYVRPFYETNENVEEATNVEENNIKKIISDFYNLNLDNIFITIT